ncbi:MAG: LytR/AlgR family response regulator transcription factor [Flavobacteriaceae bacterium]
MKIAIIEDEPIIAESLKLILMEIDSSISVMKILSSVKGSVEWLRLNQSSCDLLFMDINLTDGLSFEIFNQIESNTPIVFVTAFDQYALDAFTVNGVDYILKPFDKTKIKQSLEKIKSLTQTGLNSVTTESLQHLLEVVTSKTITNKRKSYLVYHQDKLIPLAVDDISWFYKSNQVTYACTISNKKYVIDDTLDKIQNEVSSVNFYRANRQFIISKNAIENISIYFNGRLIINILPKPDEKIIVSKAKSNDFKNWLSM